MADDILKLPPIKPQLPPLVYNGDLSQLSKNYSFDPKGPGHRYVLMSGAAIRRVGYLEIDGDREKEIVYKSDIRYDYLINFAQKFRACAERAYANKDTGSLPGFVSKKDAGEFIHNRDMQLGFEKMASKYFTQLIQHKTVLGPYNKSSDAEQKAAYKIDRDAYGFDLNNRINPSPASQKASLDSLFKSREFNHEIAKKSFNSGEGINSFEDLKEIGPKKGQRAPVCRHYAGAIAVMMDAAKSPCHAFSCDTISMNEYGGGGHETVISDYKNHIHEATTTNMDKTFRPCLAATDGKTTDVTPLEALKKGGRILILTPHGNPLYYSTSKIFQHENIAVHRYTLHEISKVLKSNDPNATVEIRKLMEQENHILAGKHPLKDSKIRAFVEQDVEKITHKSPLEKAEGFIKSHNPIHLPQHHASRHNMQQIPSF